MKSMIPVLIMLAWLSGTADLIGGGNVMLRVADNILNNYETISGVEAGNDSVFVIEANKHRIAIAKRTIGLSDNLTLSGKTDPASIIMLKPMNGKILAIYKTDAKEADISIIANGMESTTVLTRNDDGSINYAIHYFVDDAGSFMEYTLNSGAGDGKKVVVKGTLDSTGSEIGSMTYDAPGSVELARKFNTQSDSVGIHQIFKGVKGEIKPAGYRKVVRTTDPVTGAAKYASSELTVVKDAKELTLLDTQGPKLKVKVSKGKSKTVTKFVRQPDGTFIENREILLTK